MMMGNVSRYIVRLAAVLTMLCVISCGNDSFGPSIFDTEKRPLDRKSYTFALDTFCVRNFLEPYNMRFLYRMEDIASDMQYNLVPCSYDKSVSLAVLCKYLWYDVYRDCVPDGEVFLKKYSPRIIHVIGSPAYNPVQGTEVLGTAEGGIKITLYNAEHLSPDNIEYMNRYFFKTMHHEFGHILNQNVNRPADFDRISNGKYNSVSWSATPDSVALSQGFISPYASSQAAEDWVELTAVYIVTDTVSWNSMMRTASYQWEYVDDVDAAWWNQLNEKVGRGEAVRDSVGYFVKKTSLAGDEALTYGIVRKSILRDDDGKYALTDADGNIVYLHTSGVIGNQVIEHKLNMVREWLMRYFNVNLDKLRMGVQHRQWLTDGNGDFVLDAGGRFINNLTFVRPDGTTLLQELRNQVFEYGKISE